MSCISSDNATIGVYVDGNLVAKVQPPKASACDTCRRPGECCKLFTLNIHAPVSRWHEEMREKLDRHGLEFITPISPSPVARALHPDKPELLMNGFFSCTRLGDDGRCSDYENRPELCRIFEPGSDPLCIEYVRKFKGIPVVVS